MLKKNRHRSTVAGRLAEVRRQKSRLHAVIHFPIPVLRCRRPSTTRYIAAGSWLHSTNMQHALDAAKRELLTTAAEGNLAFIMIGRGVPERGLLLSKSTQSQLTDENSVLCALLGMSERPLP